MCMYFYMVGWMLLCIHRNHRLIRDRSLDLLHSSWILIFYTFLPPFLFFSFFQESGCIANQNDAVCLMQQISASVICLCPSLSFMFMKQTMQVKEVGAILTLLYPLNYTRQEQAQKPKNIPLSL